MRRLLLSLLAFMMLAQSCWAAVSVCCIKEFQASVAESALHGLSEAHLETQEPDGSQAQEVCALGHCHCNHAPLALSPDDGLGALADAAERRPPPRTAAARSHIPEGLDRPNWLRA